MSYREIILSTHKRHASAAFTDHNTGAKVRPPEEEDESFRVTPETIAATEAIMRTQQCMSAAERMAKRFRSRS